MFGGTVVAALAAVFALIAMSDAIYVAAQLGRAGRPVPPTTSATPPARC